MTPAAGATGPVLNHIHPTAATFLRARPAIGVARTIVLALLMLHAVEMTVLAGVARASGGRWHTGSDAMHLSSIVLWAAMAMVGWQMCRLLRGYRSLSVAGLAVQSGVLMTSVAVATDNVCAGVAVVTLATGILAGWGWLARTGPGIAGSAPATVRATGGGDQTSPAVDEVAVADRRRPGVGAALVGVLTFALVLAALSARSGIVFGLAILAVIFVPLERLFPLHPRRVLRRGWRTDVVHYLVNGTALKFGLIATAVVVGGLLRALVPEPLRLDVAASPTWVQIVAGLAISAIGNYAGHRAAHEIPLLWRFHRVHHSVRELDWLAANHLHPVDETFIRSAAVLPMYALGFGRIGLGTFAIVITLQAVFIHANVKTEFGPLRWLIATPHFHHWHHAREPQAHNSNYAGEFPLLDAIFGTLYLPTNRWPAQYGLDDLEPAGYLRQLAWPLTSSRTATRAARKPRPAPASCG
ncbi:MAG: sterol desaturase family protein [Mycobacterium sp.]|nr:sterol desaturase family protein [Mycobacterium sp.]